MRKTSALSLKLLLFFFAHIKFKSVYISPPPNREDTPTPQPSEVSVNQTPVEAIEFPQLPEGLEKKPIVLKFSAMLDGITIGAALLPSLKAEYKMGRMKSHGMTGTHNSIGTVVNLFHSALGNTDATITND